jgi:hypothetical protein
MMTTWLRTATERVADFTVGTVIVVVHLVIVDQQRRRNAARSKPTLPPGRQHLPS